MTQDEIIKNQMLVYLTIRLWECHEKTDYEVGLYFMILPGGNYFSFDEKEMKVLKEIFAISGKYLPGCAEILEDYERLTNKS